MLIKQIISIVKTDEIKCHFDNEGVIKYTTQTTHDCATLINHVTVYLI